MQVRVDGIYPVPFSYSLAVVRGDGTVYTEGDSATIYPLASVTKILATRAVLIAIDRGVLTLDTPMGPPDSTVKHLLCHASGLAMNERIVQAAPGVRRIYSNVGIEILAEGTQDASATEFSRWVEETIFEPLGMPSTDVCGSPAHSGRSNVDDLVELSSELLSPRLVSSDLDNEAINSVFPELVGLLPGYGVQKPNNWGLGVEIRGDKRPHWTAPSASPDVFGHFGMSGSFLWVDRGRDLAAIFLGEENFGSWHRENWPILSEKILQSF